MKQIFRTVVTVKNEERFLIDAEHVNKKITLLKIHPVFNGHVGPNVPPCHLENVKPLVDELERVIAMLPES